MRRKKKEARNEAPEVKFALGLRTEGSKDRRSGESKADDGRESDGFENTALRHRDIHQAGTGMIRRKRPPQGSQSL